MAHAERQDAANDAGKVKFRPQLLPLRCLPDDQFLELLLGKAEVEQEYPTQ